VGDPDFVDAADYDFRIFNGSAAVGAADPSLSPLRRDYFGEDRGDHGCDDEGVDGIDIGAIECSEVVMVNLSDLTTLDATQVIFLPQ
jgi:hypothetical protein